MNRICVYTKDIQLITGKSERHCREIIKQVRLHNNKEKHQPITIHELCEYLGFDLNKVGILLR